MFCQKAVKAVTSSTGRFMWVRFFTSHFISQSGNSIFVHEQPANFQVKVGESEALTSTLPRDSCVFGKKTVNVVTLLKPRRNSTVSVLLVFHFCALVMNVNQRRKTGQRFDETARPPLLSPHLSHRHRRQHISQSEKKMRNSPLHEGMSARTDCVC